MEENKDTQSRKTAHVPPTEDAPMTIRDMQGQAARPERPSREDLSSRDQLQDAAERTSCGTATAKSSERQTATEGELSASVADAVVALPDVPVEPDLLAKPGRPAPTATALRDVTTEHSRPAAASPDAAPKNTAAAMTKESAVVENALVVEAKGQEQEGRHKRGSLQSGAKPVRPHSPSSTPGTSTPLKEMEESVDRSAYRQLRTLRRSSKFKAACFALTVVLLIVVSGVVVYTYVIQPGLLVAPLRSNRSTGASRAGTESNITSY